MQDNYFEHFLRKDKQIQIIQTSNSIIIIFNQNKENLKSCVTDLDLGNVIAEWHQLPIIDLSVITRSRETRANSSGARMELSAN